MHVYRWFLSLDEKIVPDQLRATGQRTYRYPAPWNLQPAYVHFCCPECTPVSNVLAKSILSLYLCQI